MSDKEFQDLSFFQNERIKQLFGTKIFKGLPFISVIIFCNEAVHLKKTIVSIQKQSIRTHEIIIVFDQGTKENYNKINDLIRKYSNIKLLNNTNCQGTICSIYNGIKEAKGNYTLILQPGMTLYSRYTFEILSERLNKKKPDILEFQSLINMHVVMEDNSKMLVGEIADDERTGFIKAGSDFKLLIIRKDDLALGFKFVLVEFE